MKYTPTKYAEITETFQRKASNVRSAKKEREKETEQLGEGVAHAHERAREKERDGE